MKGLLEIQAENDAAARFLAVLDALAEHDTPRRRASDVSGGGVEREVL